MLRREESQDTAFDTKCREQRLELLNINAEIEELVQDIIASKVYNDITFNDITPRAGVETLKQSLSLCISKRGALIEEHNKFIDDTVSDRVTTSGYEKVKKNSRQLTVDYIKQMLFKE